MAELEIDQSNLPRVQEVCQTFAVLEDGVLAHSLQEQEIEQYYTTNIQKNQLVQNDIRVARRLQHEEEQQRAQQSALFRQVSREEQDFEYARVIQEDLQRRAEEAHRREQDDEEIAKQLQEEEEQQVRRTSQDQEDFHEGTFFHFDKLTAIFCKKKTFLLNSGSPRRAASQSSTTSWSNQGHVDTSRQRRPELREPVDEDSEDSDTVFTEQLSVWARRLYDGANTAPRQRQASLRSPQEADSRPAEACERRCHRSESVSVHNRSRHRNGDLARTWSCKENPGRSERSCQEAGRQPEEETLSSDEEQEAERRAERPRRRALHRSQSFSSSRASSRHRSRHVAAGASLQPEPSEAGLDLGALHQVLQDEELARKLQEEEDKQLRRKKKGSYPEGDFRVAQVAQDEEIARFMQKQEIKAKRRSRELEGPGSWHKHRAMMNHYDRRAARERQVPGNVYRERLDSEGLPSPTEDCSPENQPPSPVHALPKAQQMRNIAEELDPTFQGRVHVPESFQFASVTGQTSEALPTAQSGSQDLTLEEPTFIPPTKRQADKSGRSKPKEKREGCKQQ
uniref:Coiled-coil domain-containing protein 50-like n=1 Tax=Poecilia formosa TaxID=48698 RepID=A0A087XE04_POEFO